jgi:hypothetical protein
MKDKKANSLIIMLRQIIATGLLLVLLTCLLGSGCKSNNNFFSLPSYSKSAKTKPYKNKNKKTNTPITLDEMLGLPRS